MHRFYGSCEIDHELYRVKTTILEHRDRNKKNKAHNYEVTKIELLDDLSNSSRLEMVDINPSISAAKLLNNIEKSYDFGKNCLMRAKKNCHRRVAEHELNRASQQQQPIENRTVKW